MARTPDKDIKDLVEGLRAGPPKARPRRPQQKPQNIYLVLALATLIGGAGYVIYSSFIRTPETPSTEVDSGAPENSSSSQTGSGQGGSPGVAGGGGSTAPQRPTSLRPLYVLNQLPVPLSQFGGLELLPVPAPGKPVEVYVLLAARLDSYTEQLWVQADMLSKEAGASNPFVRRVTIKDMDAMNNLIDWHVESVALVPPPPPLEK